MIKLVAMISHARMRKIVFVISVRLLIVFVPSGSENSTQSSRLGKCAVKRGVASGFVDSLDVRLRSLGHQLSALLYSPSMISGIN